MDPLSDLITLLRPHAVISKPVTGRGEWGVRYAAYRQPGFAIILEGECWLTLEGAAPALLRAGDFVLLPATPAFTFASRPDAPCADFAPSDRAVHHGATDGPPDFRMFGGAFSLEAANAPLLLTLLPDMIQVSAAETGARRLAGMIDLLRDECDADRPGRDMIVERLLEIMLVECLRWQRRETASPGLLAGMRDPGVARALRAIHADIRFGWTVGGLARHAGMSRSVFAARFQKIVGCAPIEYLARWRFAVARDALIRGDAPLERIADRIGYESASAFSTAFRRRTGCAPGAFARRRGAHSQGDLPASGADRRL